MVQDVRIEDVFKVSGVPTYTFVRPSEFTRLQVSLRTPGRGVVVEGPSGIGKSTAVTKALDELGIAGGITKLSARVPEDIEYIELLLELKNFGTVVIDDFHRLPDSAKSRIADLLKVTADIEDVNRKLVIIGINEAGRTLISSSPDLSNRIDVLKFEIEPDQKVDDLVRAGEEALNISMSARELIVERARGSFYLAQLLSLEACVVDGVMNSSEAPRLVDTSFSAIQRRVVEKQRERFGEHVRAFARGTKFRPGGRAPYLHILRWLAESDSWSISLRDEMRRHPKEKSSVGVVLEAGYLASLCSQESIAQILHFDTDTGVLSVENPLLIFYLRNITWGDFIAEVGFTKVDYTESYDFALSFAGEDRTFAEVLRNNLEDLGHTVFYDLAEQHRFLGQDIEAYIGPIYSADSSFVLAVLGEMYGSKRWTLFESSRFEARIERGEVIPIWSAKVTTSAFDTTRDRAGLTFDPDSDLAAQGKEKAEILSRMLSERT